MSQSSCLSDDQLCALLLGELPEEDAAPLEGHLIECPACVARVGSVRSADVLVTALRTAGAGELPAEQSNSVERLIERLSDRSHLTTRAVLLDETVAFGSDKGPTVEQLIARLQPALTPDELGRLGSFRVLKLLGRGGMGAVFLAEDTHLRRHVALKLMRPDRGDDREAVERFMREARAAAAVHHDNVVTIYQVGEVNGVPFLAQELLEGETLDSRLKRGGGALPAADAVRIAREIAAGLAAAHARGVLHRDVKPSNIWLQKLAHHAPTDAPRTKLLDFGLARHQQGDESLTQDGCVVGTPAFMSPEQAAGHPLDARSDLFSLGGIIYRMVTGRRPFHGTDTMSMLRSLAVDEPPPAHVVNPQIPVELSDLITELLRKDRDERPVSAAQVESRLAAIANTLSAPRPQSPPPDFTSTRVPNVTPAAEPVHRKSGYRPIIATAASIAGLLIAATIIITITRPDGSKTQIEVEDGSKIQIAAASPSSPSAPIPTPQFPDRRAAEWVLSIGGVATVQADGKEQELTASKDLSSGDFKLTGVDLRNNQDASVAELEAFEGLTNLAKLHLSGAPVTDAGIENLRASPNISSLWLDGTKITDASTARIGRLSKLVNLSLVGAQITDEGLRQLSGSKTIRFLYISSTKVTDAGIPHLARMSGLMALHLDGLSITDAALAPLKVRKLTWLRLRRSGITDEGLKTLAEIKTLEELNVELTNVTPAGISELQRALPKCKIECDATTATATQLSPPSPGTVPTDTADRQAAQWAVRVGGKVTIESDGETIEVRSIDQLPAGPFRVVKLDLAKLPIKDHDLIRLNGLSRLNALELGETAVTDAGLKHLEALATLERLILYKTSITDAAISSLAKMKDLRELSLSETKLTSQGWSRLNELPNLTTLYLVNLPLGDSDLANLVLAQPQLEQLYLWGTGVTDAGMPYLADLKELRLLDLTFTKVTGRGLETLGTLPRLEALRLPVLTAADEGARHLARSSTLQSLRIHHESDLSDAGMIYLGRIKSLEELFLPGSDITVAGLAELANLRKIRALQLAYPPISDVAAGYLSQLANLETLTLAEVQSDKGLDAISQLQKLQQLRVAGKNLSAAGIQRLKVALPQTDIQVNGSAP